MEIHEDLEQAALIRPEERDYNLLLQQADWGSQLDRWEPLSDPARHFSRRVSVHTERGTTTGLEELIVPFPSAPIYGINRKAEYSMSLKQRPNMHTVRLLRRPDSAPIHRLFILYNGLNETDTLKLYYRLADWIMRQQEQISDEEGAACLIMPFPGHLMHSSFHGPFSETPLSRYLNDAGDLFRQFLRYMVEMRWLLSMVADSGAEPWMVGGTLLDADGRKQTLFEESEALHEASHKRIKRASDMLALQTGSPAHEVDIGEVTGLSQVTASESLLRSILGRDLDGGPPSMRIHVVGYSLGGFLAQSVFFSWPQIVSSCTTICSGGALSALSPTAFAQPEEWQSVLHALRPELSNSMLQGRLGDDERTREAPVNTVAGMPLERFGYFQRIFEQVFLQEDRSSYKERLSEYGLRMLFVSGGEDPIVPPANILDASPKEGTTMLSIAGMTHFLNQEPRGERGGREREQREFWLPEAGGLIARAAIHSERVHEDESAAARTLMSEKADGVESPRRAVRPPRGSDLLANSDMFESALDWVLDALTKDGGWLLVCRNTLPAAFVPPEYFTLWGTALHHHDVRIQQYAAGLRRRAEVLREAMPRTTLMIPDQLEHWFVDLSARFDPHSDGPGGRMTSREDRARIWREFEQDWSQIIMQFKAGNVGDSYSGEELGQARFAKAIAEWQTAATNFIEVTHLPDVWISIQAGAELISTASDYRVDTYRAVMDGAKRAIEDQAKLDGGQRGDLPNRERLERDLKSEHIRVVQVSGAEFNPRYRGKIEKSPTVVTRLLASCAAGLIRSRHIEGRSQEPAA